MPSTQASQWRCAFFTGFILVNLKKDWVGHDDIGRRHEDDPEGRYAGTLSRIGFEKRKKERRKEDVGSTDGL